jgi:hypothetical protein
MSLVPDADTGKPGTIAVMGPCCGVSVDPAPGTQVSFGRNLPELDVGIGGDDARVSRRQGELNEIQPGQVWTGQRDEHIAAVRMQLARAGIPGLTCDGAGNPVGNVLNHNLPVELVAAAVLTPPDLRLLDQPDETR